jgi:transcriptional regulator with XRE-family HTH domain
MNEAYSCGIIGKVIGKDMTNGNKIKELRVERGMTLDDIAYKLDTSRQSVESWESNLTSPSTLNLVKLADLFQVDLTDLLSNEEHLAKDMYKCINELMKSEEKRQRRNQAIKHLIKNSAIILGCYTVLYLVYWLAFCGAGAHNYISYWAIDHQIIPIACVFSIVASLLCWEKLGYYVILGVVVGLFVGNNVGRISYNTSVLHFNNGWIALLACICIFTITGMVIALLKVRKRISIKTIIESRKAHKIVMILVSCIILLFTFFVVYRSVWRLSFTKGADMGYQIGYEQGRADKAAGLDQNRGLSDDCFPESFVFGTPEYNGFALYWPTGYMAGYGSGR